MSTKDEIEQAIAAHAQWKQRLNDAIESGRSDWTPSEVRADCNCLFGKWLYGGIDPREKSSKSYLKILGMHALFHREAGTVLELALSGGQQEAKMRVAIGGVYLKISSELIHAMKQWQASL